MSDYVELEKLQKIRQELVEQRRKAAEETIYSTLSRVEDIRKYQDAIDIIDRAINDERVLLPSNLTKSLSNLSNQS